MKNIYECTAIFNDCTTHCQLGLVHCLAEGHQDNQCHLAMLHCANITQFAALSAATLSPYMKEICELCIKACEDCIKACQSQGDSEHHLQCIKCCQACIEMCKKMMGSSCCK